jgi:hypothetical protein
MKMEIDSVISAGSAGPAQAEFAIVPAVRGPRDVTPAGVSFVVKGEGRTVRFLLGTAEARAIGEMMLVCGCVAEGGPPPVLAPVAPASPLILNGRH